jgi:eukaryotic-like serine/threonine-protein kinase
MTDTTRPEAALSPPELDEVIAHCDRFEAAWKAGAPVRIEDVLADAPQGLRAALFGQLLALEVELRRDRGDRPRPEDYRVRFHDHAAAISAAFARLSSSSDAPSRPDRASSQNTARDLLFGLLAFQNGFIDRDALLGAFNAWTAGKSRGLGDLLHERGSLDAARYELMNALVGEHLKQHGGDPEASLAALSSVDSARADLEQVADTAVLPALSIVGTNRPAAGAGETALHVGATRKAGNRFRILQFHRKGGLGQIHVARDEELGRDVALKEILPEKAHLEPLRSRFVLEAEINGGLEHPGIVPIYSLGHYADGKPYYAMRFVQGDSLKEAIEEYHRAHPKPDPSTVEFRKLLARFIDVCETIAYAHSRGVLHRDLKPQNIMLGRYGEALIIDWGLAKATGKRVLAGADTPEATLAPTSADSHHPTIGALGSPPYMSPEQARGEIENLGPATDVYGLGATLYHLLTGRPPIQSEPGESVEAILEKVRQASIVPPRSVNHAIPAALEAICMKAMALRPEDRFPSAKALSEDIEHWLADEQVAARPDSPWARAARWGRKHRTAVASLVVLLATALVATSAAAFLIDRERGRAVKAEGEAKSSLAKATEQEQKAQQSESEARAILLFLEERILAAGRPKGEQGGIGREVTLREAIDKAAASIASEFADKPLLEAAIRDTLGTSYFFLGDAALAIPQYERSRSLCLKFMAPDDPRSLDCGNNLANAYSAAGRFADAASLHEEILAQTREKMGPDHADTLSSMGNLGSAYLSLGKLDRAIPLLEETFRRSKIKSGPDDPGTLACMNNLATAYQNADRLNDALALYEETYRRQKATLDADHPSILRTMSNLAREYDIAGRPLDAIRLLEETLSVQQKSLGPNHSHTLLSMNFLALAYRRSDRISDAIRVYEDTLRRARRALGADHDQTATVANNLAVAYLKTGRAIEAVPLLEEVLRQKRAQFGEESRTALISMDNLAQAYRDVGRLADAIRLQEQALKAFTAKFGPEDTDSLTSKTALANTYAEANRLSEAQILLDEATKAFKSKLGLDHLETLENMNYLAAVHLKAMHWEKAEQVLVECLSLRKKKQPPDSWTFQTMSQLGDALVGQKKFAEAEALLLEGYDGLNQRGAKMLSSQRKAASRAGERLISLYEAWGKNEKAAEWKAKLGVASLPSDVFARP